MAVYSTDTKLFAIALRRSGCSYRRIAAEISSAHSTIHNWVGLDDSNASLERKRWKPRKLPPLELHLDFVILKIEEHGKGVSHKRIAELLWDEKRFKCDPESVRRLRIKHDLPRRTRAGVLVGSFKDADGAAETEPPSTDEISPPIEGKVSTRIDFVRKVVAGLCTVQEACEEFDVKLRTGYDWVNEYHRLKKLKPLPKGGDKRSVDFGPHREEILQKVESGWTQQSIAEWLGREHGVECSRTTVGRFLQRVRQEAEPENAASEPSVPSDPHPDAGDSNETTSEDETIIADDTTSAGAAGLAGPALGGFALAWPGPQHLPEIVLSDMKVLWGDLHSCFKRLTDRLQGNAKKYSLPFILFIVYLAAMIGMDRGTGAARFARMRMEELRLILGDDAPETCPDASTVNRILRQIDPDEMEECGNRFLQLRISRLDLPEYLMRFFMDGKYMKGSGLTTVSVMEHLTRLTFAVVMGGPLAKEWKAGQRMVDEGMFPAKGNKVSTDGLYGQRKFARSVISKGAHYNIVLRRNQKDLYDDVVAYLESENPHLISTHVQQDVKRPEVVRKLEFFYLPESLLKHHKFPGLKAVARYKVTDPRRQKKKDKEKGKPGDDYRIWLLSNKNTGAETLLRESRGHWIGEEQHLILDETLSEDRHQARKGGAPISHVIARRAALNDLMAADLSTTVKGKLQYAMLSPLVHFAIAAHSLKSPECAEALSFLNEGYKTRKGW